LNSYRSLSEAVIDDFVDIVIETTNVSFQVIMFTQHILILIRLSGAAHFIDESLAFTPGED